MAIIRPVVKIDQRSIEAFAKAMSRAAARQTHARAEKAADFMLAEANRLIRRKFVIDRAPQRRHKGTTRLIVSLRSRVSGTPTSFPINIILEPKPGVSHVKLAALEHGQRPRTVLPPVLFPGNDRISKKTGKPIGKNRRFQEGKFRNAYGANDTTAKIVHRRHTPGRSFMGAAREATIQALRSGRL